MTPGGFPHSEIRGSKGDCPSPRLIAAFHVLRRLPVPRHPPCALGILLANKGVRRNDFFLVLSHSNIRLRSYRPCSRTTILLLILALVMIQDHVDVSRHQFRTDAARYADVKVPGAGALGTGCWRSWPDRTRPPIWFCLEVSQGGELKLDPLGHALSCLPRKEVIQPHLPVRLPCYDFTPLTLHTFDASAPCGFGRRLRVQTTRVV